MSDQQGETIIEKSAGKRFLEFESPAEIKDLSSQLQKTIKDRGWQGLMPVQANVIPYLLESRDVIVQSRTGTGKTAAFLIPICEKLKNTPSKTQALILVPTRELAMQVFSELEILAKDTDLNAVAIYGGSSYAPQFKSLDAGARIVIGTPGRILDHLIKGSLKTSNIRFLVFDEADELLSMGFYKDMLRIGDFLPQKRCSAMFSATMPESVKRLAQQFLHKPEFIGLSNEGSHISDMDHIFYTVEPMNKDRALMNIIELEDPQNGIIFCNTKSEVEYVAAIMKRFGYDADQISGDLSQTAREIVMQKLRQKALRFLIATDVAARGIDIGDLEYVFIYDMHKDPDQYVHRAGRTARAGKRGVAITLVSPFEATELKQYARRAGIVFEERAMPDQNNVQAKLSEKLLAKVEAGYRDSSTAEKERMKRFSSLLDDLNEHDNMQGLILFLLDSYNQYLIKQGRIEHKCNDSRRSASYFGLDASNTRKGRRPRNKGR